MDTSKLPQIVALAGYAGSGKDTAALGLEPLGYRHEAFAAPLKAMALELNPIIERPWGMSANIPLADLVDRYGWTRTKRLRDVREYLQFLGTEVVRRHLGYSAFVGALQRRIAVYTRQKTLSGFYPVVITDCRFANEAQWVLNWPTGIVIWINRPGIGPVNGHPSESADVKAMATFTIDNDGDPEQLQARVRGLVESW